MVRKIAFCLLLGIFLGRYGYGQTRNGDSLFNNFRVDILIEQQAHKGRIVWDDETRESYYLLLLNYPIETLVKYTDDLIPAVRSQIFAGLAQKGADEHMLQEILDRHSNDSAEFILSPTDVVLTWTVKGFMQMILDAKRKSVLSKIDYASRLKEIRSRFRIIIPGANHGIIDKDSLLKIDSLTCSPNTIKIYSFEISDGRETIKTNNVFSDQIRVMISKVKHGDMLYFEEIVAERFDMGGRRHLNSISLQVK